MTPIALGLGSNLGDRLANLQAALDALGRRIDLREISPVYETQPMYFEDQPPFYNAAVIGETDMAPAALLRALKESEREIGRMPSERYGPREIDIDLLSFGSLRYSYEGLEGVVLQVPHPKTPERRFVLQPLFDVMPHLLLPGLPSLARMLEATEGQAGHVRKLDDAILSLRGD